MVCEVLASQLCLREIQSEISEKQLSIAQVTLKINWIQDKESTGSLSLNYRIRVPKVSFRVFKKSKTRFKNL